MTLLITGGASGIGAATGEHAVALPADVSSEADIVTLFDAAEKALGPVTHLVNSAGIGLTARVADFDAAALERLFTVNTVGLMLCCREGARRMSTKRGGKGGVVVNVSSMAGTIGGRPGASAYAASKAAVDSFTMGFAKDVALEGIRAVSLRPGMIETEMTEKTLADSEARSAIESTIAMGRVGQAQEIANAIVWLLSDEASFISGVTLDASGGGFVFGKR